MTESRKLGPKAAARAAEPVVGGLTRRQLEGLWARLAPATGCVEVETEHGRYLVDTRDGVVGRSLFVRRSRSEMTSLLRVIETLQHAGLGKELAGSTFLDVGANIGTTSVTALLRGPFRNAVAIEPAPANVRLLRANAFLNGLADRLTVVECAISDAPREGELRLHETNSGGHQIANRKAERTTVLPIPSGDTVPIRIETLDSLVDQHVYKPRLVGLVWIDVQGQEGYVLKGASRLLEKGIPLVFEYFPGLQASAGGHGRILHVLERRYTHFADLSRRGSRHPELRPITPESLAALSDQYLPDRFTNILALRLSAAAARRAARESEAA